MITARSPLPLVVLLGLFACKEDGPASSAISGLPENKKVSDLTVAEQEQLCEATIDYTSRELPEADADRALCSLQGIVVSTTLYDGSADACVTARDECLASIQEKPVQVEETCEYDWVTCMVTVRELEACMEEAVSGLKTFYEKLDCDNIEQYRGERPVEQPELGQACRRVQTECPEFLPGDLLSEPKPARAP